MTKQLVFYIVKLAWLSFFLCIWLRLMGWLSEEVIEDNIPMAVFIMAVGLTAVFIIFVDKEKS